MPVKPPQLVNVTWKVTIPDEDPGGIRSIACGICQYFAPEIRIAENQNICGMPITFNPTKHPLLTTQEVPVSAMQAGQRK